jgi:hypothetical protein
MVVPVRSAGDPGESLPEAAISKGMNAAKDGALEDSETGKVLLAGYGGGGEATGGPHPSLGRRQVRAGRGGGIASVRL